MKKFEELFPSGLVTKKEKEVAKIGWNACKKEILKIVRTFKNEDDFTNVDRIEERVKRL